MKNTEFLSKETLKDLKEEGFTNDMINNMTRKDILQTWLEHRGFYGNGYAYSIVKLMCELFPMENLSNNGTVVSECDFDCKIDETEEI